jgi:hypothetical protein
MDKPKREATQGRVRNECFQEENEMSSPILPTQGPIVARPPLAPAASRRLTSTEAAAAASGSEPTVSVDTFPSSPPPEVLDELRGAAQAWENLRAQGHELHFGHDEQTGRIAIELRDREGNSVRDVSPSEALELVGGKPLGQE